MPISLCSYRKSAEPAAPLAEFVACAHQMLDPATPEPVRRNLEPRLLALLPVVRALGLFELFVPRHAGLRAWLDDELTALGHPTVEA